MSTDQWKQVAAYLACYRVSCLRLWHHSYRTHNTCFRSDSVCQLQHAVRKPNTPLQVTRTTKTSSHKTVTMNRYKGFLKIVLTRNSIFGNLSSSLPPPMTPDCTGSNPNGARLLLLRWFLEEVRLRNARVCLLVDRHENNIYKSIFTIYLTLKEDKCEEISDVNIKNWDI